VSSVTDSRSFLREVLGTHTGVAPEALQFEAGPHGKPALAAGTPGPAFNLTHSGDWLLCAVGAVEAIGVDLEFTGREPAFLKLARRFFAPEEVIDLEALPADELGQRFFDYWTLKEAAVKAAGGPLAPGLAANSFTLSFNPGEPGRVVAAGAPGDYFCLFDPLPGYRAALCLPGVRVGVPRLSLVRHGQDAVPLEFALRAFSA